MRSSSSLAKTLLVDITHTWASTDAQKIIANGSVSMLSMRFFPPLSSMLLPTANCRIYVSYGYRLETPESRPRVRLQPGNGNLRGSPSRHLHQWDRGGLVRGSVIPVQVCIHSCILLPDVISGASCTSVSILHSYRRRGVCHPVYIDRVGSHSGSTNSHR